MRYVSTRDTSKTFEFKDVFIKGLADDGGLFIPETLVKYGENEMRDLKIPMRMLQESLLGNF